MSLIQIMFLIDMHVHKFILPLLKALCGAYIHGNEFNNLCFCSAIYFADWF